MIWLPVFLGSFLLFSIQPMLAKALLPYVGGTAATWVVTALFFQFMLLLGYGYATIGSVTMTAKRQSIAHIGLLIAALLFSFPLSLNITTNLDQSTPEVWVLMTLLATIGLPFALLSANATLLQRWHHELKRTSPYFLFAISNIGSMLGLLGYPFLIEWLFPLSEQLFLWSILFYILLALLIIVSLRLQRSVTTSDKEILGRNLPIKQTLLIIFCAFIPSSLFLSATLFITTDIAPMPLLWVIPLALYLLSFVIVFSRVASWWIKVVQYLHIPSCVILFVHTCYVYAYLSHFYAKNYYELQIGIHLFCLFVIATHCHGVIARNKPAPVHLSYFYLWLSVGGVLGGLLNTIAPYLFDDIYEYWIVLLLSLSIPLAHVFSKRNMRSDRYKAGAIIGCALIVTSVFLMWLESKDYPPQFKARNFYGVKKVTDLAFPHFMRTLHVGSTLQGFQPTFPADPLYLNSNIKKLAARAPSKYADGPFAIIGLGTGTLSCMAQPDQQIDFFELDPLVLRIAQDPTMFTYLRDCPGKHNHILGDGRIQIAKEPEGKYKLIILDAFNSNATPMHLLTAEAVNTYLEKLDRKQGMLAFNLISRHVNLRPMLANVAHHLNVSAYYKLFGYDPQFPFDGKAEWLFIVENHSPWIATFEELGFEKLSYNKAAPLWTDGYSNILNVLR